MNRMSGFRKVMVLVIGIVVTAGLASVPAEAQQRVQVEFWHGLTQPLGGILEKIAQDFNASQSKYQVNATFKGSYPETMVAAVAAFRAGNAPHIVQMFEVGTATMMAARGAIKPVYELAQETGVNLDPKNYVGGVRGYYSTADGKLVSMPFNSSTPVFFYNKDAFKKAGLDPNKPPKTWDEAQEAALKLRDAGVACSFTTGWQSWVQLETMSAWHNQEFATKSNGFGGMDAKLNFNNQLMVRHIAKLAGVSRVMSLRSSSSV